MPNYIGYMEHRDNQSIPEGKAILVMDNNGFVGTNTGHPMIGQPALCPRSQAQAIALVWNYVMSTDRGLSKLLNKKAVPKEVLDWIEQESNISEEKRNHLPPKKQKVERYGARDDKSLPWFWWVAFILGVFILFSWIVGTKS